MSYQPDEQGLPPQVMLRINVGRLIELLCLPIQASQDGVPDLQQTGKPECGNTASRFCANRQTRMWDSHILILRKAADKVAGKSNDSQPDCAKLYIEKLITRSMSTKPPLPASLQEASAEGADNARGGDLIFPTALLPQEQAAASALARRCPQVAQAMLDELAGRMGTNTIRTSPIAYLRGLIARAQSGEFVPELGIRVAAARRSREEAEALRQQQAENTRELNAQRNNPEYQARIDRHREEIRRVLGSLTGQRRAGRKTS